MVANKSDIVYKQTKINEILLDGTKNIAGGSDHQSNTIPYKQHKRAKRKSQKSISSKLKILGVNCDGLQSKKKSLENILKLTKPTIFTLQETKYKLEGNIKIDNYNTYEKTRKNQSGGGIAIGIDNKLKSAWVSEGPNDTEVLTVNIAIGTETLRAIVAYGPQEYAKEEDKKIFWDHLKKEMDEANKLNHMAFIQMDGNCWAGPNVIKSDQRSQNRNGKLLQNFLEDGNLFIENNSEKCEGIITRKTLKNGIVQESILDFLITNEKLHAFLIKMKIDEERLYPVTNYKKDMKHINSDHFTIFADFDIVIVHAKPQIKHINNYKKDGALLSFKEKCDNTEELSTCFTNDGDPEVMMENWNKTLHKLISKCFPRIKVKNNISIKTSKKCSMLKSNKLRIKKIVLENTCHNCGKSLIRTKLFKHMKKNISEIYHIQSTPQQYKCKECVIDKEKLKNHIEHIHKVASDVFEAEECVIEENDEEYKDKFKELHKLYNSSTSKNISQQNMWKIFNSIGPDKKSSVNFAIQNHKGKILYKTHEKLSAMSIEYTNRLRQRPAKPGFEKIRRLDAKLFEVKLAAAVANKSEDITEEELDVTLSKLKLNKARDADDLHSIIFKSDSIGLDLRKSLLHLTNTIKNSGIVPKYLRKVCVSSIPQSKKGSRILLINHRGIFNVSLLRNIIMKTLYTRVYPTIDKNLSEYNIGARKGKTSLINIFILNSIINRTIKSKIPCSLNIVIADFKQMFDGLILQSGLNELYNLGVKGDELNTLYQANKEIFMSVKSDGERSKETTIRDVWLQGDTFAPIAATCEMDNIASEWLRVGGKSVNKYGNIPVGTLGQIDDTILIATPGPNTTLLNAYMNTKSAVKALTYGIEKCEMLRINSKGQNPLKNTFKIDIWDSRYEDDIIVDKYKGKAPIKETENKKYLGVYISTNGKNKATVEDKIKKAIWTIEKINNKLDLMKLGKYYFQTALFLRQSVLLSSLLYGTEVLFGLDESDLNKLESKDRDYIRRIGRLERSAPTALLYLEMGITPVRCLIKMRRLQFLKYILEQKDSSLIKQIYKEQKTHPSQGDWSITVENNLKELNITYEEKEIQIMSKNYFNNMIKYKISEFSFVYLNEMKGKLKKGKCLNYSKLEAAHYLLDKSINVHHKRDILKARLDMVQLAGFFPNKFDGPNCQLGCPEIENYEHLVECANQSDLFNKYNFDIKNLYGQNNNKMKETVININKIIEGRKILKEKT